MSSPVGHERSGEQAGRRAGSRAVRDTLEETERLQRSLGNRGMERLVGGAPVRGAADPAIAPVAGQARQAKLGATRRTSRAIQRQATKDGTDVTKTATTTTETPSETAATTTKTATTTTETPTKTATATTKTATATTETATTATKTATTTTSTPTPTPTPTPTADRPVLRWGSRGARVRELQLRLNAAEPAPEPPLAVDGYFQRLTRDAVVAFQSAHDLLVDGIVGPQTWTELDRVVLPELPEVPPAPGPLAAVDQARAVATMVPLYDERSIRIIQGVVGTEITGVYDAVSAQAVAQFQRARGLSVDGIVDHDDLDRIIPNRVARDDRDQAIHLVTDLEGLDTTSDTLVIRFAPGLRVRSDVQFEAGGHRVIRLAASAFRSARTMAQEIRTQLAVPAPAAPATLPVPSLLDGSDAIAAVVANLVRIDDVRSIRIIEDQIGADRNGRWDEDDVQLLAAFQTARGIAPTGIFDEDTLVAVHDILVGSSQFNALLRVILDFYRFEDLRNLLQLYFDPNLSGFNAVIMSDENQQPNAVAFTREGMTQGFTGLVHTVAHEMAHVRLNRQGETNLATHEFFGESVEILSEGMREEELFPGFAADADRCVDNWNDMPPDRRQAHRERFLRVREKVFERLDADTEQRPERQREILDGIRRKYEQAPVPDPV